MKPYWPGTNTPKSINNAFSAWKDGVPSVFAADRKCRVFKDGLTQGQYMAEMNEKHRATTGSSRGTIKGLKKADKVLADRHGGVYSKAGV